LLLAKFTLSSGFEVRKTKNQAEFISHQKRKPERNEKTGPKGLGIGFFLF